VQAKKVANEKVQGNAVHLSTLRIINGCLAFDVCSGKFHRVSDTAAFILSELIRRIPVSEIVASYSKRYKISPAIAARDVELFLSDVA
jgi:Coenzyme PQQ synthesis protein D (PqqD)